jgi:hypothetical protein
MVNRNTPNDRPKTNLAREIVEVVGSRILQGLGFRTDLAREIVEVVGSRILEGCHHGGSGGRRVTLLQVKEHLQFWSQGLGVRFRVWTSRSPTDG